LSRDKKTGTTVVLDSQGLNNSKLLSQQRVLASAYSARHVLSADVMTKIEPVRKDAVDLHAP